MKKKSIILFLDTSDNKKTEVAVTIDGKKFTKIAQNSWSSQKLLPLVEELLNENKIKLTDVSEIKFHEGPGSYTGLRVGAAVANTLAYLLKIQINGKKNQIITPNY